MSCAVPESILEKLRKIKLLSEQGIGGEARNALCKLETMLKQHGLTMNDLAKDDLKQYNFPYSTMTEKKLLVQIAASILKSTTFRVFGVEKRGRVARILVLELNAVQYYDISMAFAYYKKILKIEQKRLLSAFIQQHELYPPSNGECQTKVSAEEASRLALMMAGLVEKSFIKPATALTYTTRDV